MSLADELVERFRELAALALLEEGDPNSFRVRAYENAVFDIPAIRGDLAAMSEAELCKHRGIGKSTARKIREYLDTGSIAKLEELRAKFPPAYVELSKIPGLGPKKLAKLRSALGIESVADLRAALAAHRLRELPGFGTKTEENIERALDRLGMTGKDQRTPIAEAMPVAAELVSTIEKLPGVEQAMYCGSLRRFRETIGDLDIVVAARDAAPIMEAFAGLPEVAEVLGRGDTKTSILTRAGMQVDLRVVAPEHLGAATLYFTGSKAHNIRLRQRAIERGWTLNEYALSHVETGEVVASATEEDIYRALELAWVPPPMREDTGEVERAAKGELPELVSLADLRGDLHCHTTLSGDGKSSLEEIVAGAAARGYAYLAITDHGEDLAINGVPRERLLAQKDDLARVGERYPDLRILHGCELNIGPDGGLDYDEDTRAALDFCIAGVHSHFDLPQAQQTERIIRAMHDPCVKAIAHLTGRRIGRRPGIDIDADAVFAAAAATGTAIELNASLARLDAAADLIRRAPDGVVFTISTDCHHTRDQDRMRWGVEYSQRAWLPRDRVLNTRDLAGLLAHEKTL